MNRIARFLINKASLSIFLFLALSSPDTDLFAQDTSGFYAPLFGARGLAQGNAFVARADDVTTIYFNPAGLTQLKRLESSLGASFVLPLIKYRGQGVREGMSKEINMVPNTYVASPIVGDKLAAGLSIVVPFGFSGKWSSTGFARYIITDFDLGVIDINPSLAFKPFSFLSIGAGLDYYKAESDEDDRLNVGLMNSTLTGLPIVPGTPDGFQRLKMHGDALGYKWDYYLTLTQVIVSALHSGVRQTYI